MEVNSKCECCGSKNITPKTLNTEMSSTLNGKEVKLDVAFKVYYCKDCDAKYTAQEAERLRGVAYLPFLKGLL